MIKKKSQNICFKVKIFRQNITRRKVYFKPPDEEEAGFRLRILFSRLIIEL